MNWFRYIGGVMLSVLALNVNLSFRAIQQLTPSCNLLSCNLKRCVPTFALSMHRV